MGIAIDLAMNNLNGILTEATEGEDSVCYVTENDAETLQVAVDIMRKYQEIEKIVNEWNGNEIETYIAMIAISEVVKNGSTN